MHCTDNRHASAHTIGYAGQRRILLWESLLLNLLWKTETLVGNAILFQGKVSKNQGNGWEGYREDEETYLFPIFIPSLWVKGKKLKEAYFFP